MSGTPTASSVSVHQNPRRRFSEPVYEVFKLHKDSKVEKFSFNFSQFIHNYYYTHLTAECAKGFLLVHFNLSCTQSRI